MPYSVPCETSAQTPRGRAMMAPGATARSAEATSATVSSLVSEIRSSRLCGVVPKSSLEAALESRVWRYCGSLR